MSIELGALGAAIPADRVTREQAAAIEEAGYGTLWLAVSPPEDLVLVEQLLDATDRLVVATSIVNMWTADARTVAASYHRIVAKHPNRFLLGVGIGHHEIDAQYAAPYDTAVAYLETLSTADVPQDRIVLAALGPRMLRLARERTAGTVPVMVTPEHTRRAREILGAERLVLPGQQVLLDTDVERARATARARVLTPALHVSNYNKNLRRLGFTEADLTEPGSDRLIDALVLHGDATTIVTGLQAHREAGADHVIATALADDPLDTLRAIAARMSTMDNKAR